MMPKDIILKALARERKHERGLRVIAPDNNLAAGHVAKANHNLVVMTDLSKLGHSDWVVIAAYYSMYHAATAVLSKIGLDSKDHATTASVLEYFFGEKIGWFLLRRFNEMKDRKDTTERLKIEERFIRYMWKVKQEREIVQYGIQTAYRETDFVMRSARDFVTKMKLVLDEINDEVAGVVKKEIGRLKSSVEK